MNASAHGIENKKRFIDEVNDRIWTLRIAPSDSYDPVREADIAMALAHEIGYPYGIARCKLNYGMGEFILRHNTSEAFRLLNEALSMFKNQQNERWISNTQLTMAIIGTSSGRPDEALYPALKGIAFYENKNNDDDYDAVMAYYVMGTVFKDLKKYHEARKYYESGLKQLTGNSTWFARIFTSLSNILNESGDYVQALELANKSLDILVAEDNKIGVSRSLSDIGVIHKNLGQFEKALSCFFESLKLREEAGVKQFALGSLLEIADVYKLLGDHSNAVHYFKKAETLALETSHESRLAKVYRELAQLFKAQKNLDESVSYFEKYLALSESLYERDRAVKIETFQNTLVQEKEKEIERLKNVELKEAYELISEKNKEITDSIHYAQRIQNTLLASREVLASNFKEHFVLYQPKDIVSGDFYWTTILDADMSFDSLHRQSSSKPLFCLAVCDSTGHGVPGAFMSLLNITFLNEAINQKRIREPGKIFDYVRERLVSSVSQDGAQDGMDGTLLCIEKNDQGICTVNYASANNRPLLVSNGKLVFLEADKMPVGKGEKINSFNTFRFSPEPGDVLYLFTDGYADQFGGPKGKKFRNRQLEELLLNQSGTNLVSQRELLLEKLNEWKGSHEQVDDILIVGLKF